MSDYAGAATPDHADVVNFMQGERADDSLPLPPAGAPGAASAPSSFWSTFGTNSPTANTTANTPATGGFWSTFGGKSATSPDAFTESGGLTPDLMGTPAKTYVAPTSTEGAKSVGESPASPTVGVLGKVAGALWSGVQHVADTFWRMGPNEVLGALTGLAKGAVEGPPGGYQQGDPDASLKGIGAAAKGAWQGLKSGFYGGQGFYTPMSPLVAAFKGTPIGDALGFKPIQATYDAFAPIQAKMGVGGLVPPRYNKWPDGNVHPGDYGNGFLANAANTAVNITKNATVADLLDLAAFGPVGEALTPLRLGRMVLTAKPVMETPEAVQAAGETAAREMNLTKGRLPAVEAAKEAATAQPKPPLPEPLQRIIGSAGKAYRPMGNEERLGHVLEDIAPEAREDVLGAQTAPMTTKSAAAKELSQILGVPRAEVDKLTFGDMRDLLETAYAQRDVPSMIDAARDAAKARGLNLDTLLERAAKTPGTPSLGPMAGPSARLRAGFAPESLRSGEFVHQTGETVPFVTEGNQRMLNPKLFPANREPVDFQPVLHGTEGPEGEAVRKAGAQAGFKSWPPTLRELHDMANTHFAPEDAHAFLHDEAVKLGIPTLKNLSETNRAALADHLLEQMYPLTDGAQSVETMVTGKMPNALPSSGTQAPQLANWTIQRPGVPQQIGEDVQLTHKGLEFRNPLTGESSEILPKTQDAIREAVGKALSAMGDKEAVKFHGKTYTFGDMAQLFSTTAVPHGVSPEGAKAAETIALGRSLAEQRANSMASLVHNQLAQLSKPLSVPEEQVLTHLIESGAAFTPESVARIVGATQGAGEQQIAKSLLKTLTPDRLEELRPLAETVQDIYREIGKSEFERQMLPALRDERYVTHLYDLKNSPGIKVDRNYFENDAANMRKGLKPETPYQERLGPDTLLQAIQANKEAAAKGLPSPFALRPGTDRLLKNLEIRLSDHAEAMGRRWALDKMLQDMPHVVSAAGGPPGAPSDVVFNSPGMRRVFGGDIRVDSRFAPRLAQLMGLENWGGNIGKAGAWVEQNITRPFFKVPSTILKFPTFQERVWAHNLLKNYLGDVSAEAQGAAHGALAGEEGALKGPFTVRDMVLTDHGWEPQAGAVTHYDSLPYKDLRSLAESEGVLRTGVLSRTEMGGPITRKPPSILPEPGTPVLNMPVELGKNLVNAAQQATEHIDNQGRLAHFISKLQEYGDSRIAGRATKRAMFDYYNITPFEKEILRPLFPFYTWTRKSVPYIASQYGEEAGKIAALTGLREKIEQMQGLPPQDHSKDREWGVHVKIGNQLYNITPGIPLNDPNEAFHPVETAGRMVTPLISAPAAILGNYDTANQMPIARFGGKELAPAPFPLQQLGIGTPLAGKTYIPQNYAEGLRKFEPGPMGMLNEPYGKNPPPLPWLTGSLLHNVTNAYNPAKQAAANYRDTYNEYMARRDVLQQMGVKVPGMNPLAPFLRPPAKGKAPLPPLRPGSIHHKG